MEQSLNELENVYSSDREAHEMDHDDDMEKEAH